MRLLSVESVKYKVFTKGFTTVRSARDFNLFFLGQALPIDINFEIDNNEKNMSTASIKEDP